MWRSQAVGQIIWIFSGIGKLSVWTSVKVREYYNEVEQEDEDLHKEGSLCRTYAHIGTESRLKTTFGGFRLGTEKSSASGGVRLVAASTIGKPRTESWSYKTAGTVEMKSVSSARCTARNV